MPASTADSKSAGEDDLAKLQDDWKRMFQKTLPTAATSKSSSQPRWPVHVDHCFARIILDSVVGNGTDPWMSVIKSPAYKNMSREQLKKALKMGQDILDGEADLEALDEVSLKCRGKASKTGRKSGKMSKDEMKDAENKRKRTNNESLTVNDKTKSEEIDDEAGETVSKFFQSASKPAKRKRSNSSSSTPEPEPRPKAKKGSEGQSSPSKGKTEPIGRDVEALQQKINASSKTPFQKSVLSLILQIPDGQYSTYNLLSKHLSSSPRAVGNALRNNPFAPDVPCHRVLATGGGLGGFGGSWGKKGEAGRNDDEKRRLLREEGVRFDGRGKVVGSPWAGFT